MNKPTTPPRRTPPRLLRVSRTEILNSSLKRVFLSGTELKGFPSNSDGAHIKLMFPKSHQPEPVLPTLGPAGPIWPPDNERPITRTYSVAFYDETGGELAVDFVMHGDNGPGSRWANRAQIGDAIGVAGPGGPDRVDPAADWFLLVGDPSALAALNAALRQLPQNARGYVFIEIGSEQDIIPLQAPAQLQVQWLIRRNQNAGESRLLIDAVQAIDWLAGTPSIMLAGENSQVVAVRDYVLQHRHVAKKMLYAVPYWKDQYNEEAYHNERHRIMDELDNDA